MKTGFKERAGAILKHNGLLSTDAIGTVWSEGNVIKQYLNGQGFSVESGVDNPTYDYIVIGKSKANLTNLFKALTLINSGGIIVIYEEGNPVTIRERTNLYEIKS